MLKELTLPVVITTVVIIVLILIYIYLPKYLITSKNKYTVLMAGQSVTDQWFRNRELPDVLNNLGMWRNWHIPYDQHMKDDVYYKKLRIPSPRENKKHPNYKFGENTLKTITKSLDEKHYDALMFKYCFVDYGDSSINTLEKLEQRFNELTKLVEEVHKTASERDTKLILGNAMPSFESSEYSQELRFKFNKWVDDYVKENEDIAKIELFDNLL